ncbi:hypothetical protein [Agitococcus lubricus]|uniref:Uncharacterized protein n=1 Tax=Agitococcus lubricus TaxID=1077255 RepID=A0A2T5J2M0_9GAMM|nr:hypothetical protein [Agitococcus lubricus]PTQ90769.1 hypothetical protein C8N29_102169 [Agitococcus lubricus]
MRISLKLFVLLISITLNSNVFAQLNVFSSREAAINTLFPHDNPWMWTSAEGDLTGDGTDDVAMIITLPRNEGEQGYPIEKKVLVLAGLASGGYTLLSVSGTYCDAQKFYNLEIVGSSLFVTAVHKADASGSITHSSQYRFNKKYSDLELIGREDISESFADNSYYRLSINYLNGSSINYEKNKGSAKSTKKTRFHISSLQRLNGFDCEKFVDNAIY